MLIVYGRQVEKGHQEPVPMKGQTAKQSWLEQATSTTAERPVANNQQ